MDCLDGGSKFVRVCVLAWKCFALWTVELCFPAQTDGQAYACAIVFAFGIVV
jgi:hypothetical protein